MSTEALHSFRKFPTAIHQLREEKEYASKSRALDRPLWPLD